MIVADCDYPVKALWLTCSQILFKLFGYQSFDSEYTRSRLSQDNFLFISINIPEYEVTFRLPIRYFMMFM
jgi:hypothetical protein